MELATNTTKVVTDINYLGPHQIMTTGSLSWNLNEVLKNDELLQMNEPMEDTQQN